MHFLCNVKLILCMHAIVAKSIDNRRREKSVLLRIAVCKHSLKSKRSACAILHYDTECTYLPINNWLGTATTIQPPPVAQHCKDGTMVTHLMHLLC